MNVRPSLSFGERLELELRPEQQVTEGCFDRILLIQMTAGADIEQVDIVNRFVGLLKLEL